MRISSFFISLFLHLGVMLGALFWPASPPLDLNRPVYQVSLVMGDPGGENLTSAVLGARAPVSDKPLASTTLADKSTPPQGEPDAPALPSNTAAPVKPEAPQVPRPESLPQPRPEAPAAPQPEAPKPATVPEAPKVAVPSEPPKPVDAPKKDPPKKADPAPQPEPTPKPVDKPAEKAPDKPVDKPADKTPPKPNKPKSDPLGDALADVQRMAGGQSKPSSGKSGSASRALDELTKQSQVGVGGGAGEGDGPGGGGIYDVYAGLVMLAVKPNWSMPTYSRENIAVQIRIQLDPQGKVLDCTVARSSGRVDFDASAVNAVMRTASMPTPPTPEQQDLLVTFNALEMAGR